MITNDKRFTDYQIAKYKKMIDDNTSLEDSFNDTITKLKLISALHLDDISPALSYSLYLYVEDLEDSLRALEIRCLKK